MLRAGATDDIADVLHRSDTTRPVDVLIVARLNDVHALSVARRIEDRGGRTLILDAADYPSIWQLTTRYERGCIARNVTSRGREVDLSQLRPKGCPVKSETRCASMMRAMATARN